LPDTVRITPQVQYSRNQDEVFLERIVDGVGEPLGQKAVISEDFHVDAAVEYE